MTAVDKTALTTRITDDVQNDPTTPLRGDTLQGLLVDSVDSVLYRGSATATDAAGVIYKQTGTGEVEPAALSEETDRLTSTKSLQSPPGSLFLGDGLRLSSGLNTLVFQRAGGTQQSLISLIPYDSTGNDAPVFFDLATEIDFPVTTVFDTQLTAPQTITFVPATVDNFATKFVFRPAESGTLRIRGFTGPTSGGDLIIDFNVTVSVGQVGTNVEMDIPSPILTFVGDQVTVETSGLDLFGGLQTVPDYTGQTLPFVTLRGHTFSQVQYTTPNTLSTHLKTGTAATADTGGAIRDLLQLLTGDDRLPASAVKGLPDIPDQARLHFTSATFTNATRTLQFTRDNGTTLDVVIPESTSGFLAPRITEFTLPNTPSRIGTTDDLIGDLSIQFHISNSADQDSLSLLANSVNVGAVTTFTPDGLITGQTVNISAAEWTSITTADSTQVVFQLSGPDKNTPAGTTTSNTVTVQIADVAASEFFYYGTSTTNNPSTIDVSTLTSLEAATGTFTLDPIDPAAGDFLMFLAPQDHDLTALVNTGINRDVLSLFTETQSVRTINSQLYDSYVLGPANDVPAITYQATLA